MHVHIHIAAHGINTWCNNRHFCTNFCTSRQTCKDAGHCSLHIKMIKQQYQVSEGAGSSFDAYQIFHNVQFK